jgi:hypothetical protein
MSLKAEVKALKALIKPKTILKFIFNESEIVDEPGTIWILYSVQRASTLPVPIH